MFRRQRIAADQGKERQDNDAFRGVHNAIPFRGLLAGGLLAVFITRGRFLAPCPIPVAPNTVFLAGDIRALGGKLAVVVKVTPEARLQPVLVDSFTRALTVLMVRGK
jgi:hypothetical protein